MVLCTNLGQTEPNFLIFSEGKLFSHPAPLVFSTLFPDPARIPNSGPWRRNYFCMISWKGKAPKHGSLKHSFAAAADDVADEVHHDDDDDDDDDDDGLREF